MQMIINALLLAVLMPAVRSIPQPDQPRCRAHLEGSKLTTTIEFTNGYRLEAPWKVLDPNTCGPRAAVRPLSPT